VDFFVASHKIQPHIRGNRFYNYEHEQFKRFIGHTLFMYLTFRLSQKKVCPLKVASWVEKSSSIEKHLHDQPVITWIGHSTFLIQCAGVNILTDPIFGGASFFYPRVLPAGLLPHQLPSIDIILLSHNHRDHMDSSSLHALRHHKAHILVPKGDKAWFEKRGFERVQEFTWWQQTTIDVEHAQARMRLTFLPAMHWSQRGLFDKNKSLWGSWMIEAMDSTKLTTNGGIYFAGDTAYSSHFKAIAQEFPLIDIAMMPIGPCEPRSWMDPSHISAQQAGQAFLDLQAHHFIPMHWGTFAFGTDEFDTPMIYLREWWWENSQHVQSKQLHLPKIGAPLQILLKTPYLKETSRTVEIIL